MAVMTRTVTYLSLIVATLAVSLAAIFIRWADADPIATAFYRMAFATLILAPFAIRGLARDLKGLSRSNQWLLVVSGVILGLHFASWITSLKYTTISNSVMIVTTQPFFVAVAEAVVWKVRIRRMPVIGMVAAFIGMVIISGADFAVGGDHLRGDFLALIGAVCAGAYLMLGRQIRQSLSNLHYIFPVYFTAAVTLLIIALAFDTPLTGFSGQTWLFFALLGLIPTVVGHSLYNFLLKYIQPHLIGVTILGEPIGATLFAALIFGEYPPMATYIGGGLILIGITMALIRAKSDVVSLETA